MNGLHRLLSHIALALALGTVLLVILDGFNPRMAFLTSTPSHVLAGEIRGISLCRPNRHPVMYAPMSVHFAMNTAYSSRHRPVQLIAPHPACAYAVRGYSTSCAIADHSSPTYSSPNIVPAIVSSGFGLFFCENVRSSTATVRISSIADTHPGCANHVTRIIATHPAVPRQR